MKFLKLFGLLAFSGLMINGLVSCGSDDPEPVDEGNDPVVDPGQVDESVNHPMTSTEAGNYLDETASKVSELFNPNDQKEVIDVFNNYIERYGEYDFDGNAFNFEVGGKSMLTTMAKSFVCGLSTGDLGSLSRAANTFVRNYEISFDKIKGIYTPDTHNETWLRDPSGNDVVFLFGATEIRVQVSGGNWDFGYVDYDYDYDYDWENDTYNENYYEDHYNVSVPKNIVMTVTESGKELVKSVVETNLDIKGKTFHVKTNLHAANISLDALVDGNNSLVQESQSMYVGGTRLLASVATLKGSNLCDVEYLSDLFDEDIEDVKGKIDNVFGNGDASINLLDRVQVKIQTNKIGTLMAAGDYDEYVSGGWNSDAESNAGKFASVLNNNVKASMYFGNTSAEQAKIEWQKYYYEYYAGSGEWLVEPVIVFNDGSRFTFEEYFNEDRFANAENKFASLFYLYASLW